MPHDAAENGSGSRPDWLARLHVGAGSSIGDADLGDMFSHIWGAFGVGDFAAVDTALEHAEPAAMPTVAVVAILRYAFRCKDRLVHWNSLLERCRAELCSRGAPVDGLLRGLGPNAANPLQMPEQP